MTISFPSTRLRRNRKAKWSRDMLAENWLHAHNLIWPIFVQEGEGLRTPITSMSGVDRVSIDILVKEVAEAYELGIVAIALFPVVTQDKKSKQAEEAFNPDNLICRAIRAIKEQVPDIGIIGDVALDPYTLDGQDGLVIDGYVDNDSTVEALCRQAVTLAAVGCDIVAPSDMMDGRIGAIRRTLEEGGYHNTQILSYAAKYASCFYGPFRDAVGSASNLGKGSKHTYQMDAANSREALQEVELDIAEGADMVMIKPAMPYLDVVNRVRDKFFVPVLAYQVSGEYAMIRAAAGSGIIDFQNAMLESLLCIKRAGATAILTYAAKDIATYMSKSHP